MHCFFRDVCLLQSNFWLRMLFFWRTTTELNQSGFLTSALGFTAFAEHVPPALLASACSVQFTVSSVMYLSRHTIYTSFFVIPCVNQSHSEPLQRSSSAPYTPRHATTPFRRLGSLTLPDRSQVLSNVLSKPPSISLD